jgi:hypothetical protein
LSIQQKKLPSRCRRNGVAATATRELKFFGDLSVEEIAEVLKISASP